MSIKKKILIFFITIVAATSIIFYLIILPTVSEIRKISKAIYDERVDLEKKYLRGQLLKKTMEDFEMIKPKKNQLASVFLTLGQELNFITTLEKIAGENRLTPNIQLNINEIKEKDDIKEIPIILTVQGNFIQTMDYLSSLERLNYYINLSSLKLTAGSPNEASGSNIITTILSGKINAIDADQEKK